MDSWEIKYSGLGYKGKRPSDIGGDSEWQNGPEFLTKPISEWPISSTVNVKELPERVKQIHVVKEQSLSDSLAKRINLERFSKFQLLINTTARVLNLYERFKKGSENKQTDGIGVSVESRAMAERFWVMEAQKALMKELNGKKMAKLVPRIKDGIIEVGGRTDRWMGFNWNRQLFILLPGDHKFSKLVAKHQHEQLGHKGVSANVAQIRSKYWIIGIRNIVRKLVRGCVGCIERHKVRVEQIMSSLPVERLKPCPPFTNTGVDYFGPFTIKGEVQKRVRSKCYGVIFACMTSRAIHVDLSQNYSCDAFLQVVRRFCSIRGWPQTFFSDNGTQIVAASKELKQVISDLDQETLHRYSVNHGTTWKFSPASAPWYNGHVEALVKSVKKCLNSTLRERILSFCELQTVMYEVAQIVNQRPIGTHPSSPEDGSYICPNDLILGRASSDVPQGPLMSRVSDKYRFDHLQNVVEEYWKKWSKDVFPNLCIQPKWHVQKRTVKIGDIVMIEDSNQLRGKWRLGIVNEILPSEDGRVRKVKVGYKNFDEVDKGKPEYKGTRYTEIMRPVQRLVVLLPKEENQT